MELLRVIKRTTIPVIFITLFIVGMCLFQLQNTELPDEAESKKRTEEITSYVNSYKENKLKAIDNANYMSGISLFNDANSYSFLNIQKTSRDAVKLADAPVAVCNTSAVEEFMNYSWLPIMFVLIVVTIMSSFKEEEYNGINILVRTAKCGRIPLAVKRLGISFGLITILSYLINGLIFGIYLNFYGGAKDLGQCIQSSMMFSGFPLILSIREFFIVYCALFAIGMYGIGMLAYALIKCTYSNKLAYVWIIVIGMAEYLLYSKIDGRSALNFLKYINVFSILSLKDTLSNVNWGRDGFITDTISSTLWTIALVIVLTGMLNVYLHSSKFPCRQKGRLEKLLLKFDAKIQEFISRFNAFMYEIYKLLFAGNGLIILFIFIIICSSLKVHKGINYGNRNKYINEFYNEYQGLSVNEDVYKYLEKLDSDIEKISNKENITGMDKFTISDMEKAKSSLTGQVKYLENIKSKTGIDVRIIDESTYIDIFGERMNGIWEGINSVCILAVILMFSNLYNYEKKTGMVKILKCSNKRVKVWRHKLYMVIIGSCLISVISYILHLINILDYYDLGYLHIPIQSISMFGGFPLKLSILGFMIYTQLVRTVIIISVGLIVMNISYFMSYIGSVLTGLLLLLPHVLHIFKLPYAYLFSIPVQMDISRSILTGNQNLAGNIFVIVLVLSSIGSCVYTYIKWNRNN